MDPGTRGHEVILANNGGYGQVGQYIFGRWGILKWASRVLV